LSSTCLSKKGPITVYVTSYGKKDKSKMKRTKNFRRTSEDSEDEDDEEDDDAEEEEEDSKEKHSDEDSG
jgi:hypothetical protein